MPFIMDLDRTVCLDFLVQRVLDENYQAVLGHGRAIKVRLVEPEVCAQNVRDRVVGMNVIYGNPQLELGKTRSMGRSSSGEIWDYIITLATKQLIDETDRLQQTRYE
jgi:hypothetical protein